MSPKHTNAACLSLDRFGHVFEANDFDKGCFGRGKSWSPSQWKHTAPESLTTGAPAAPRLRQGGPAPGAALFLDERIGLPDCHCI